MYEGTKFEWMFLKVRATEVADIVSETRDQAESEVRSGRGRTERSSFFSSSRGRDRDGGAEGEASMLSDCSADIVS
jgi:hypothetical protein